MKERLNMVCPKLNVFNDIYIKRNGIGLVHDIELKGSKEDIEAFIEYETDLLFKAGIILNKKAVTDKKDMSSPQLYLLRDMNGLRKKQDNLYFYYGNCADSNKNIFDVTGFAESPVEEIINLIHLEGLKEEDLLKWHSKEEFHTMFGDGSYKKFVNDLLIKHYEKYNDDVFHPEELNSFKERKEEPKEEEGKKLSEEEPKQMEDKKPSEEEPEGKEEKIPDMQKESNENGQDIIPKPEKKKESATFCYPKEKEVLSSDEIEENKTLLEGLTKKYKEVIDYVTKLHSSQWITLCEDLKNAVKNKSFAKQWCPMYLSISDDVSTELYARLYQLDEDTKKFHETITHQIVTLGCFSCGKDWKEDITFLEKGPLFFECPHCYCERGYEKA